MSKKDEKTAKISFFELIINPDQTRVAGRDWDGRLSKLSGQENMDLPRGDRTLDGFIQGTSGNHCLSLSLDRALRPRERHRGTGVRQTMKNSGDEWDPAEETVVVFFERNIFGTLNTGLGAPTHTAVANWLNRYSPPASNDLKYRWLAKPIARDDVYQSVIKERKMQITQSTFTVFPEELTERDLSILGIAKDAVWGKNDGLELTLTLQAGRGNSRARNAQEIGNQVDDVLQNLDVKRARVNAKAPGGKTRTFDLLESHMTHSVDIPVSALEDGDRFAQVANTEIRRAFDELRDLLIEHVPEILD